MDPVRSILLSPLHATDGRRGRDDARGAVPAASPHTKSTGSGCGTQCPSQPVRNRKSRTISKLQPTPAETGMKRRRGWEAPRKDGRAPQQRGWTRVRAPARTWERGFPAHAGMDPCMSRSTGTCSRLPRTRGDGPVRSILLACRIPASPHTRGWTRAARRAQHCGRGFPAHAGMELLAVIERTPACRDRVALRKVLIDKDLSKGPENAYPSYGKFLWVRLGSVPGVLESNRPGGNPTGVAHRTSTGTH